jgi:hypothetical protein
MGIGDELEVDQQEAIKGLHDHRGQVIGLIYFRILDLK